MAAASHPVIHDAAHNSAHLFHFTVAKAGMDGLDREKINQQIYELSKNSAYFKASILLHSRFYICYC